jgi:signal transduction histidine kinase
MMQGIGHIHWQTGFRLILCALALTIVTMLCAQPSRAWSSETVILDSQTELRVVGTAMQLLEDPDGQLDLQDMRARTEWQPATASEPNLGFTSSAIWARFKLRNEAPDDNAFYLVLDDAILNLVDIYFIQDDGAITHHTGGGWVPVSKRDQPYRTHAFSIPGGRFQTLEVYVRVRSELAVVIPLKIVESRRFAADNTLGTWIYSLYFGFMGAMLVVNAIVGIRMRQSLNLYYCGFSLGIIIFGLSFSGFGRQFLWPAPTWIDNVLLSVSAVAASTLATAFNEQYLYDTRQVVTHFRRYSRRVVGSIGAISIIFSLAGVHDKGMILGAICAVAAAVVFMANVFVSLYFRLPHAWLLLLAWIGMVVGVGVFAGRGFGVLPSNAFTTHALQIASIVESALLALAIIEKARYLRQELEMANREAQANLEREVQQRTSELRYTQQRIIEQERRKAMVVFAAGAAHEINNPANFIAAGAQQAAALLDDLNRTLCDLMDEDVDPGLKQALARHFEGSLQHYTAIRSSTTQMTTAVAELRKLNPEADEGTENVDIVAIAKRAIDRIRLSFHPDIHCQADISSLPLVSASHADLNAAFEALILNAFEAFDADITQGRVPATCTFALHAQHDDRSIALFFADNGPGIPAEAQQKIFEPFYTTKASTAGSGLGLSVARDLIERHGGTLQLEPDRQPGACFVLRFAVKAR